MDSKLTILILLMCIGTSLASSVCYCDNFDADSPYSCVSFGDCCNYCKEGVSCGCDNYCKHSGDCCSYCEIPGNQPCFCSDECTVDPTGCCDHCTEDVSADMIVDNSREN